MNKIIVVGTTGSGKSTLSKHLSEKLNIPHIQLDALFWKKDWGEADDVEFFESIEKAIDKPQWVVDGNFARTNHITWKDADTVIWIDYPFWLTFYQNFTRSFRRSITKREIWKGTGNTESFSKMFSKDSILLWLIKTYSNNIKRYEERMSNQNFPHITFHRLKTRKEVSQFLGNIL